MQTHLISGFHSSVEASNQCKYFVPWGPGSPILDNPRSQNVFILLNYCHPDFLPIFVSAGIQSFCRDLVEVADILNTTLEIVVEEDDDPTLTLNKICEGLTLIEVKLQSIFTKHGLQKMNPIGGRYDPYDHEIVCHVPAENMQPGTVALVTVDGYKLHGRTIRHAHVGVAVESQECDEPAS